MVSIILPKWLTDPVIWTVDEFKISDYIENEDSQLQNKVDLKERYLNQFDDKPFKLDPKNMCPYRSILGENIIIFDPSENLGDFETPGTRRDILNKDENGGPAYIKVKYE